MMGMQIDLLLCGSTKIREKHLSHGIYSFPHGMLQLSYAMALGYHGMANFVDIVLPCQMWLVVINSFHCSVLYHRSYIITFFAKKTNVWLVDIFFSSDCFHTLKCKLFPLLLFLQCLLGLIILFM